MKTKNILLGVLLLLGACSKAAPDQQNLPEPDPELIPVFQIFEPEIVERSVTIDKGKENERTLSVQSMFPYKKSNHSSDDGSDSIAFIDYQFAPHKEGEPYTELKPGVSLSDSDFKAFYFRIGNHSGGKGFDTVEDLLRYSFKTVDSAYIFDVEVASLPMLMVDFGSSRHYFYRIANHRSLQIVIASTVDFVDLDPRIIEEIDSTLDSLKIIDRTQE